MYTQFKVHRSARTCFASGTTDTGQRDARERESSTGSETRRRAGGPRHPLASRPARPARHKSKYDVQTAPQPTHSNYHRGLQAARRIGGKSPPSPPFLPRARRRKEDVQRLSFLRGRRDGLAKGLTGCLDYGIWRSDLRGPWQLSVCDRASFVLLLLKRSVDSKCETCS